MMKSVEAERSPGWTRLYLLVVAFLAAQIAFYAWLTETFR